MRDSSDFGTILTAMVTPFDGQGRVDTEGCGRLAHWLTQPGWNDALVVNGTTGEAFSTSDEEKSTVLVAVREALRDTPRLVIAGVGSADTRHSVRLAEEAEEAGADGLLVVAPYYCRPSQRGLADYYTAIADSTSLPVMVYDVPKRTGVAIEPTTLVELAEHPRITAVKDAKGDLQSTSWVLDRTELSYYSGDDGLNLPHLSVGATGFVSVVGHVAAGCLRRMWQAFEAGRNDDALVLHQSLLPLYSGVFRCPAPASVKALLASLGVPAGTVRSPMVPLSEVERDTLMADFAATTAFEESTSTTTRSAA